MTTVQDRLSMLAVHAGSKSLKALAKDLGLTTPQMLYDIKSGKVAGFSTRLANKILLVYPEVNQTWLLTGEGEMLTNSPKTSASVMLSGDAMTIFLNMSDTISRQEANITKLTDMVNRLTGGMEVQKKDVAG